MAFETGAMIVSESCIINNVVRTSTWPWRWEIHLPWSVTRKSLHFSICLTTRTEEAITDQYLGQRLYVRWRRSSNHRKTWYEPCLKVWLEFLKHSWIQAPNIENALEEAGCINEFKIEKLILKWPNTNFLTRFWLDFVRQLFFLTSKRLEIASHQKDTIQDFQAPTTFTKGLVFHGPANNFWRPTFCQTSRSTEQITIQRPGDNVSHSVWQCISLDDGAEGSANVITSLRITNRNRSYEHEHRCLYCPSKTFLNAGTSG